METQYICLCEEFLCAAQFHVNENILNILKEYYTKIINSNRKLSQIKDLRTLLRILEKRDALSCVTIEPLLYISSNFLNDIQIQNKVKEYKNSFQNVQYSTFFNMYQETNENRNKNEFKLSNVTEGRTSEAKVSNEFENQSMLQKYKNYKTNCSEQECDQETILQQMLLSRISERIGRSWRDTVRYLGVPEYQIDQIQNKHPFDLKEQSYEALKLYIIQYNNSNWKINLIHALEKARRRDLRELAEKLILESINH